MEDCPVPAVGEALAPYIKSRDEVSKVRSALQTYLEKNLGLEDAHLSVNNLNAPTLSAPLPDAPSGLSGVRKAYWNALKAHQEVQAKYASLKAEIQELSQSSRVPHSETQETQDDILPVLRQREKQRKLRVIEKALSDITSDTTSPTNVNLDEFVKARAGEMPMLPNVSSTRHGYLEDADARMLDLKKAVLEAKHTVDNHEAYEDDGAPHSPQAELYALQQTRNMLITWIEQQLTVIGDAQAAEEKPVEKLTVEGEDAPIPVSKDEIGQIYEQYLVARKRLLQGLQHPPRHDFDVSTTRETRRSSPAPKTSDKSGATSASILPFIQPLLDLQSSENALTQQLSFSRKQLASAEAETDKLIRRMAGESHLVAPGAKAGYDWQKASYDALETTEKTVNGRLQAGTHAAEQARQTLESIKALPRAYGQLST